MGFVPGTWSFKSSGLMVLLSDGYLGTGFSFFLFFGVRASEANSLWTGRLSSRRSLFWLEGRVGGTFELQG